MPTVKVATRQIRDQTKNSCPAKNAVKYQTQLINTNIKNQRAGVEASKSYLVYQSRVTNLDLSIKMTI